MKPGFGIFALVAHLVPEGEGRTVLSQAERGALSERSIWTKKEADAAGSWDVTTSAAAEYILFRCYPIR